MKKKQTAKVISITASCGGQGCRTHEDILPIGIVRSVPVREAA